MDFFFFENLPEAEAAIYLERYRQVEGAEMEALVRSARDAGIVADFSLNSISPVLMWLLKSVRTVPLPGDKSLSSWIRQTSSYKSGLFDFTEESKPIVLRASFYFGESFVRSFPGLLNWATGRQDTAECNMPVVTGFEDNDQLAPMLVVENLFRRILKDPRKMSDIERTAQTWSRTVGVRAD